MAAGAQKRVPDGPRVELPLGQLQRTRLKRRARSSASIFLHLRLLPLHELGRRVNAAKLQDVVAHGGLEQHREVATCRNRNDDFPDGHAQDIFRLFEQRESLRLVRSRAIEMHDQPQIHLRAHSRLAEYRADVEHAQAAHFQKILQYRRAPAFERGHRDARDVDDIVRNEPVAAADQFQRELAFPGARVTRDEHPESEHVHAYSVALRGFRERLAEIAAQPLDDLRAGHIGGEHRGARGLGRLQHAHIGGRSVGDDDGYRVEREEIAERLEEFGLAECGQVRDLVVAEYLDAVGMDEIEVPYERGDAGTVAPKLGRAAGLSADPGEPELVAIVVIQLRDADLQHGAGRRWCGDEACQDRYRSRVSR